MKRRRFLEHLSASLPASFAASFVAAPFLPTALQKLPDRLARLAADLGAAASPDAYWRRVREEFQFQQGLVHLNCGSLGATPRLVLDAVSGYAEEVEGNPVAKTFSWGGERMEEVRSLAAEFLGAALNETALTRNTTEAMNAIAGGLDLRPGDQILTTNHEHGGGMVCWQHLREHLGVEIVYVGLPRRPVGRAEILNLISDKLTPRTKVCSFSHIDTITGLQMPLADIAELTRPRDILLVCDGAQSAGMIEVDVKNLGVDAYACSGHKWLLAPKGTGVLYIRREVRDRVHPMFLHSGYGSYAASGGTRGVDRILGLGLALEFHNVLGRERMESRCRALRSYLHERLDGFPDLELLTPGDAALSGALLTYSLKRGNSGDVRTRMAAEHDIQIKAVQATYAYCQEDGLSPENYNAIRLSTHIYNSEAEIDRTVDALRRVLAST